MLDPHLIERIRSIFLHDEPRVTIETAANMLGRSVDEVAGAVSAGEIETVDTPHGVMIDIQELAEQAIHVWPIAAIEEALGSDAALILPAGVRTRKFAARLPRYLVAALEYLAEENAESAEALLTRELHGLAYAHRERLSSSIAGFAEAVEWPFNNNVQQG